MLCVNQEERWTARQLLSHPWMVAGDELLLDHDLTKSVETMKKFRAKLRLKKAAHAVLFVNKVRILLLLL